MAKSDERPTDPEADKQHAEIVRQQRAILEEAERQKAEETKSEPVSDQQARERGVKR